MELHYDHGLESTFTVKISASFFEERDKLILKVIRKDPGIAKKNLCKVRTSLEDLYHLVARNILQLQKSRQYGADMTTETQLTGTD